MNTNDLARLRRWCGLSDRYVGFDPVANVGDCAIVEDKLLSEGWSVQISKTSDSVYSCLVFGHHRDGVRAEDSSRRSALCLAALGICHE